MKNVLVVDASPVFAEFLKDKFNSERIEVHFVQDKLDSIPKMISLFPDLVIVDISQNDSIDFVLEFLKKVKSDPNASRLPMIATGPQIEKNMIALYAKLGVSKYFVKPIKFDFFFESIGHYLKQPFSMDSTPCVLEIHRNSNIIFIEISQGLNREKLFLLRYRLSEILETPGLDSPKIILMMTNLDLTFVDGLNLELLFNNILDHDSVRTNSVFVLTLSAFVKELVGGHPEYSGMQVASNINQILNSVVETTSSPKLSDIVIDRILLNEGGAHEHPSIEMRFSSDSKAAEKENAQQESSSGRVAVLDDDSIVLDLLAGAFRNAKVPCDTYSNPAEFLLMAPKMNYSLMIVDILIPGASGFEILKTLSQMPETPPIFVYSQALKREMIIQALKLGARQYLVKPQKPETIVKKSLEVLNAAR